MPSVFTIQGVDVFTVKSSNKDDLNKLCDIRRMLANRADKLRGRQAANYQTAADIVQYYIEDQPGGREYFWSGRCGTKRRR